MAVFEFEEILRVTHGILIQGKPFSGTLKINTDTRTLRSGEAFLALRGERFDGHDYLMQAAEKGAALLIVMMDGELPVGIPVIRVDDTLTALGDLARFHRLCFSVPVVGITGSNGKTTTKEMTAAVLGSIWQTVKTEKNFNNEFGLPMTLFQMNAATEACVVEMGMRGLGQIRSLADIARPTMGIITNVGVTHIELLGSQDAIAEAKGELAEALPEDGALILNADDPRVEAMSQRSKAKVYRYSLEKPADLFLIERNTDENGQHLRIDGQWGRVNLFLPALGRHNAANALAALLAGAVLGVPMEDAVQGLAGMKLVDQRLLLRKTPSGLRILDDTYNSSPPAVEAALEAMDSIVTKGRRIVILGDMLELGDTAGQAHADVGYNLGNHRVDMAFTFGPHSEETAKAALNRGIPAHHFMSIESLIDEINGIIGPEDLVLVKGSRGMHMERVVDGLLRSDEK